MMILTTEEVQALERELWSEEVFTAKVIERAQGFGWRVAHFRPAKTARGWRTAVQGDGEGFPDLILVRGARIIAAELKVKLNQPTAKQQVWLHIFKQALAGGYLWKPRDWAQITEALR